MVTHNAAPSTEDPSVVASFDKERRESEPG